VYLVPQPSFSSTNDRAIILAKTGSGFAKHGIDDGVAAGVVTLVVIGYWLLVIPSNK